MKNKSNLPEYFHYLNFFWAILLVLAVVLTLTTAKTEKNRFYDKQIEASNKCSEAFNLIKERKEELGLASSDEDILNTGLLGPKRTKIQTTEGDPKAKRTATNPNFAAVYIDMFKEAGLHEGDEIGIVTSGSFPGLNIASIISSQVYGLKIITMTGIGASSYGASDPEFTYFDMAEYLYEKGIFNNKIDYVSFGGAFDDGSEFNTDTYNSIYSRIEASGVGFINEPDYEENIKLRVKLIYEKCPNLKLFLNVGGTIVSLGNGYTTAVKYTGLLKPNYLSINKNPTDSKNRGLLETFLDKGIPIIHMLSIKTIAYEYGLPFDPAVSPNVGNGDVYFEKKYNMVYPIIALTITIGLLTYYFISRKKYYLN